MTLLLMPLGFILPIGMAYRGGGSAVSDRDRPLLVIDYDGGEQAAGLIEKLDENFRIERNLQGEAVQQAGLEDDSDCAQPGPACDEKIARDEIRDSRRTVALILPAQLTELYEKGEETHVTLLYDPAGDVNLVDQVQGIIKGATIAISLKKQVMQGMEDMGNLSSIGSDELQAAVKDAAETEEDNEVEAALKFEKSSPTNYVERTPPNALQQNVPGYTVMFAFLVSGFMAGWSVEEKRNGVARRLLSHPVSSFSLLGGKMLYGLTLSLAQIMILFITSALAFRFDLGKDLLAFGLVCLVLSITVTCLGMLASAVKFPSSAITMPLVIFSILGGCLFTRDLMPPLLRLVSNFIPHSWAMSAFQDLFVRGYGLPQVLPELGILLVFAAVFFGVAVWLYDPLD